jgi:phage gp16-like protein
MTQSVKDPAKAAIKAIQTRRRQVPDLLDEESWRDFLAATTGKNSLRAMDARDHDRVLETLIKRGARKGPGRWKLASDPQARKMRALWIKLHQAKAVEKGTESALAAWCGRQLGVRVDNIGWLAPGDKRALIQALIGWCARLGLPS